MTDLIVKTPRGGEVRLRPAPDEIVYRVRELLPLGLEALPSAPDTKAFGIVMQHGSREHFSIKQQAVDTEPKQAVVCARVHSLLIAFSLASYAAQVKSGLLMPCPYARTKGPGSIESGIAYFAGMPSDTVPDSESLLNEAFDGSMGRGVTDLFYRFALILRESSRERKLTLPAYIGIDLRPRSLLGTVELGFLVVDGQIVALKTRITPQDPSWAVLSATGIQQVWHLPSVPFAILDE